MKKQDIRISGLSDQQLIAAVEKFYKDALPQDLVKFHNMLSYPVPTFHDEADRPLLAEAGQTFNCDYLFLLTEGVPKDVIHLLENSEEMGDVARAKEKGGFLSLLYDDDSNSFRASRVQYPFEEIWQNETRGSLIIGKKADMEDFRNRLQQCIDYEMQSVVPASLLECLEVAASQAKQERIQSPFLSSRIVKSGKDADLACLATQEKFFDALESLYEYLYLDTAIEDAKLNGAPIEAETIEEALEIACRDYRDTLAYAYVPCDEIAILKGRNSLLRFPGGAEMSLADWLAKATVQNCQYLREPAGNGEHLWQVASVMSDAEKVNEGINGNVVLRDGEPVHAFLAGREELHSVEHAAIFSYMVIDYILKRAVEESPQQIYLDRYAMIADFVSEDNRPMFSLPVYKVIEKQQKGLAREPVAEKASFSVPEHPTVKDFMAAIRSVIDAYKAAGLDITPQQLRALMFQTAAKEHGAAR